MIRKRRLRSPERHLTEKALLLHLDGELGGSEQKQAARHLRECWQCRALARRVEESIDAFMEERRDHLWLMAENAEGHGDFAVRLSQWAKAKAGTVETPAARGFRFRRLWPIGLAAAALAAVEGWRPVAVYVRSLSAQEAAVIKVPGPPSPPAVPFVLPSAPVAVPAPPRLPPLKIPLAPPLQLGPSAADLDAAELEAYLAVHRTGLCRGEDIEVFRVPGQAVRVTGVVERPEQRVTLEAALAGVPFAEVTVVVASGGETSVPVSAVAPVNRLEPRPPLLRDRLEQYFLRHGPANQAVRAMNEFSNQAVLLAATARWEAQALRKLASGFTGRRLRGMTPASRARIHSIIEEHRRDMEVMLSQLGRLLGRIEEPGEELGVPLPADFSGWTEGCGLLDQEASRMDYLANGLFAGLDLPGKDAAQAWRELRQAQARSLLLLSTSAAAAEEDFKVANLPENIDHR